MDLEEAIRIHIDNERKELIHCTLAVNVKIGIRIFETAPRNSKALVPLLERKKRELARARTIDRTEILYAEVQAYERLPGMVTAHEAGRSLEGLAY